MRKDLIRGSLVVIVFTVLLGVVYPLVMTGISQVVLHDKAEGSLIRKDGKVVGSHLLATAGTPGAGHSRRYFQARPSVTGYSGTVTYFANRGPNQRSTFYLTRQHLRAFLAREQPYDPGLKADKVPVDAVTFSASGVDPHISQANAAIQAHRVAAARKLPIGRVRDLIDANTAGRGLGVFGEPGVNVTDLNLALDQESR